MTTIYNQNVFRRKGSYFNKRIVCASTHYSISSRFYLKGQNIRTDIDLRKAIERERGASSNETNRLMPNSGSLQFVKPSEVLSHIYILHTLYRAHVHESASVSLPVREIGMRKREKGRQRKIKSGSLFVGDWQRAA